MKKMLRSFTWVVVAALFITSCSKPSVKQAKYIPADAYVVLGLNAKNLVQKIASANLNPDSLTKLFADGNADSAIASNTQKWNDIKNSGISLDDEMFMFNKSSSSIMAGNMNVTGFVLALKDATAFEQFIKKNDSTAEVKKADGYSYISMGANSVAGWNNDVAIMFTNNAGFNMFGFSPSPPPDTASTQQYLAKLFSQKESESVVNVKPFNDVLNENADMMIYVNSASNPAASIIDLTKLSDLLENSYTTATINFENGDVQLNSRSYNSKALQGLTKKYPGKGIDGSMISNYPSSNIDGFAAVSINPQLVVAIVKYAGVDGIANQWLAKQGMNFTLDDVAKAFTGDFAFVLSDFNIADKTVDNINGMKLPQPVKTNDWSKKFIFNTAIGDKASYDKIISGLEAAGHLSNQNGQYNVEDVSGITIKATDKNLYVASDNDVLQQYISGNGPKANLPGEVMDKVKGKTFSFYVDINKILQGIPGDSSSNRLLDSAKATFKDMIISSGNYDSQPVEGNFTLRLINSNENSLVTFIRMGLNAANYAKKRASDDMNTMNDMPMPGGKMPMPPPPPANK